ncbi:methyltransferase domain-containing protein [Sorangium sp. So ce119]|uniref:class I SAM-dependent methyltransferase n=1 Tax=Sorangium sp. So ce119 TaxID=3133279 RepID=UPI003F5E414A
MPHRGNSAALSWTEVENRVLVPRGIARSAAFPGEDAMSDVTSSAGDKAGKAHWSRVWSQRSIPKPVDPRARGLRQYVLQAFHRQFVRAFEGMETKGQRLLEVGCGRSAWLPYLAREFGFQISGLDYTEIGCEQEREILARAGIPGEVVCADLFDPPERLVGAFDVVVSNGVVEHFEDTAGCLRACARYLRPGGRIITEIPNMCGLVGWVTKLTDRANYDVHVPLDREALVRAHRDAGFNVLWSEYVLPIDVSLFGVGSIGPRWLRVPAVGAASVVCNVVWALDARGLVPAPNPVTSPYIFCVAEKT